MSEKYYMHDATATFSDGCVLSLLFSSKFFGGLCLVLTFCVVTLLSLLGGFPTPKFLGLGRIKGVPLPVTPTQPCPCKGMGKVLSSWPPGDSLVAYSKPPGEPRTGPRRQVSDFNWMVGRLSEAQKSSNEGINNHL